MKIVIVVMIGMVVFLFFLTGFFWRKKNQLQKKNLVHKSKEIPKFDLIEVSAEDDLYDEYYEPKIIEILPVEDEVK